MRHLLIKKRFQQAVWGILIKTEFIVVIQITYMFLYLPRVVRLSVYPPPSITICGENTQKQQNHLKRL